MIVDFTERVGAAMLILGSRGLPYWKRLVCFFFSSANDVVVIVTANNDM
jgi:hypothetical protein